MKFYMLNTKITLLLFNHQRYKKLGKYFHTFILLVEQFNITVTKNVLHESCARHLPCTTEISNFMTVTIGKSFLKYFYNVFLFICNIAIYLNDISSKFT